MKYSFYKLHKDELYEADEDENVLIRKLIKLKEVEEDLKNQLLQKMKNKKYIYNNEYVVIHYPETTYLKMDYTYVKEKYPELYEKCKTGNITKKEYITINKM